MNRALLTVAMLFLPGCLPLALDAAQTDRAAAMQRQNDERYAEIQRRLAALEARSGGSLETNPQTQR